MVELFDQDATAKLLTWCEVDTSALSGNMAALRRHLPSTCALAPAVKSNAYGHGLIATARTFLRGGAEWLCVHTIDEAVALRAAEISCPIYLFGPTLVTRLDEVVALGIELVIYQRDHLDALRALARRDPHATRKVGLHLKVETGNHRQGVSVAEALELTRLIKELSLIHI